MTEKRDFRVQGEKKRGVSGQGFRTTKEMEKKTNQNQEIGKNSPTRFPLVSSSTLISCMVFSASK